MLVACYGAKSVALIAAYKAAKDADVDLQSLLISMRRGQASFFQSGGAICILERDRAQRCRSRHRATRCQRQGDGDAVHRTEARRWRSPRRNFRRSIRLLAKAAVKCAFRRHLPAKPGHHRGRAQSVHAIFTYQTYCEPSGRSPHRAAYAACTKARHLAAWVSRRQATSRVADVLFTHQRNVLT